MRAATPAAAPSALNHTTNGTTVSRWRTIVPIFPLFNAITVPPTVTRPISMHVTSASRRKPGSVIHDPDAVVARAVRMIKDRTVVAIDGSIVRLEADTICVHGDTPGSDDLAAKIRAGLETAGITVKAIGQQ